MRRQKLREIQFCFYFSVASCIFFILCAFDAFNILYSNAHSRFFLKAKTDAYNTTQTSSFKRLQALHAMTLLDNRTYAKYHGAEEGRIVGFFHLFEGDSELFNHIVEEQLASIDASGILDKSTFVTYAYFGPNHMSFRIPSASKKYLKSPMSNATGSEEDTLQLLHEHCVRHPQDLAFYLHTKGSFHARPVNDLFRRNLMKAVLFCIAQSASLGRSDVCGLRASPVPYPQISGAQSDRLKRSGVLRKVIGFNPAPCVPSVLRMQAIARCGDIQDAQPASARA